MGNDRRKGGGILFVYTEMNQWALQYLILFVYFVSFLHLIEIFNMVMSLHTEKASTAIHEFFVCQCVFFIRFDVVVLMLINF